MRHWIFFVLILFWVSACESIENRKEFYANGTLKSDCEYIGNLKNGRELRYDSTGKLAVQQFFKNDTLDGLRTTYYQDGKISEIVNYRKGQEQGDYFKFYHNGYVGSKGSKKDGKTFGKFFIYDPYDSGRILKEAYLLNWNNEVFQYYVKIFEKSGKESYEYKPLNLTVPPEIEIGQSKYAEFEFNEIDKFDSALVVVEFSKERINNQTDLDTIVANNNRVKYQFTSKDTGNHYLRGFMIGCKKAKDQTESDSIVTYSTYFAFEERVRVKK